MCTTCRWLTETKIFVGGYIKACLRCKVSFAIFPLPFQEAVTSIIANFLMLSCTVFPSVASLDKIEAALGKFSDGPFFLGEFSLVCHWSEGVIFPEPHFIFFCGMRYLCDA
jgi:hypothetical protein